MANSDRKVASSIQDQVDAFIMTTLCALSPCTPVGVAKSVSGVLIAGTGAEATIECLPGFVGGRSVTCLADGSFSHVLRCGSVPYSAAFAGDPGRCEFAPGYADAVTYMQGSSTGCAAVTANKCTLATIFIASDSASYNVQSNFCSTVFSVSASTAAAAVLVLIGVFSRRWLKQSTCTILVALLLVGAASGMDSPDSQDEMVNAMAPAPLSTHQVPTSLPGMIIPMPEPVVSSPNPQSPDPLQSSSSSSESQLSGRKRQADSAAADADSTKKRRCSADEKEADDIFFVQPERQLPDPLLLPGCNLAENDRMLGSNRNAPPGLFDLVLQRPPDSSPQALVEHGYDTWFLMGENICHAVAMAIRGRPLMPADALVMSLQASVSPNMNFDQQLSALAHHTRQNIMSKNRKLVSQ